MSASKRFIVGGLCAHLRENRRKTRQAVLVRLERKQFRARPARQSQFGYGHGDFISKAAHRAIIGAANAAPLDASRAGRAASRQWQSRELFARHLCAERGARRSRDCGAPRQRPDLGFCRCKLFGAAQGQCAAAHRRRQSHYFTALSRRFICRSHARHKSGMTRHVLQLRPSNHHPWPCGHRRNKYQPWCNCLHRQKCSADYRR